MHGQVYSTQHRVTYAECTVGNHVYYGRYLDFLEAARGAFFRHLGRTFLQWQQEGFIFPVLECHLRYRAPARYDDVLTVELWVQERSRVRLGLAYRVLNQESVLLVTAATLHACTGLDERPRRIPEDWAQRLDAYLAPPTESGGAA